MDNPVSISENSKLHISLSIGPETRSKTDVDVIIVGAGLSGLQAAVDVHKAGFSCLILEAAGRVGGKCLSVPNLPGSKNNIDLGPAWINDTTQSHMWGLGKRYGMTFEKQITTGEGLVQIPDGSVVRGGLDDMPMSPKDAKTVNDLFATITGTSIAIEKESYQGSLSRKLDKILFQEWIDHQTGHSKIASWVMEFLTQALVGAVPGEFSALHMLRYFQSSGGLLPQIGSGKGTSQYLRSATGSATFAQGLAGELGHHQILLNTDVASIVQKHGSCHVHTCNGVYTSKKVIVSVPTPLYDKIAFHPRLPPGKDSIRQRTRMGYYSKVVLVYDRPWWRENGLNGASVSTVGPAITTLDTSVMSKGQYSISAFVTGPQGKRWSALPEKKRMQTVKDQIRLFFADKIDEELPEPTRMIEQDWTKEDWFWGAPSTMYPRNILKDGGYKAIQEKHGDVHFVGTETSDEFEGYMEGAVRSGVRGAKEVVEALKVESTSGLTG